MNRDEERRLLADPDYQYAMAVHGILAHCYASQPREFRHKIYEQAGIPKLIRAAQKRVKAGSTARDGSVASSQHGGLEWRSMKTVWLDTIGDTVPITLRIIQCATSGRGDG